MKPAMRGRLRCSLHGGRSLATRNGNRNAWKHGMRSSLAMEASRMTRARLTALRLLALKMGILS